MSKPGPTNAEPPETEDELQVSPPKSKYTSVHEGLAQEKNARLIAPTASATAL